MPIDSKIRQVIKTNGHIKIDDMMREVLSINPSSYYKSVKEIGKNGDFITSPEISQLFGETLALWAIEKWQKMGMPSEFLLLELGPGQGQLMKDFLRTAKLVPEFYNGLNLHLMEINPNFIERQKENLAKYNKNISWISEIQYIPKLPTIIIANEFFDALPIKQYIKVKDKWFESILVVDPKDEGIKHNKIALHAALEKQLQLEHINSQDGAVIEESIESLNIVRFLSNHLSKYSGSALIIDYGYNINTKDRKRNQYNSTLQAIKNHEYHSVIDSLGEADITAHVDFNALKNAAYQAGILNHLIFDQRDFLIKYGINIRLETLKEKVTEEEGEILDNQVFRLISKDQMGHLFKVLELDAFLEKNQTIAK